VKKKGRRYRKAKPCSVCGRTLRDNKSLELGMGPTCRMKYGGGYQKELEKNGQLRLFKD